MSYETKFLKFGYQSRAIPPGRNPCAGCLNLSLNMMFDNSNRSTAKTSGKRVSSNINLSEKIKTRPVSIFQTNERNPGSK
jgi:hypothetical protein